METGWSLCVERQWPSYPADPDSTSNAQGKLQ